MYFWKKGIYHNPKFKDHFVVCDVALHNGNFWEILSKKYMVETSKKICKRKGAIVMSAFKKVDILIK